MQGSTTVKYKKKYFTLFYTNIRIWNTVQYSSMAHHHPPPPVNTPLALENNE